MKFDFKLLPLFCLAFCATITHAVVINGHNYVPLADWADGNGLKVFWIDRDAQIAATNRTTRLVFTVDSHDAQINGTHVALSFPVADDHGSVLLAQFDLDKVIRPLLFPTRYIEPKKIKTICLDPGHGGKDPGNHVSSHKEKSYTLLLAQELRDQLKHAGFNVILTRTSDSFVDLPDRPALANRKGADLFVSLHFNYAEGAADVFGPETYCITPVGAASSNAQGEGVSMTASPATRVEHRSLFLAYKVQKSLVNSLGVPDRSVRRARFAVLRDATMPAILIEGGYMSNPDEGKKIYDSNYRKQMATAIMDGIVAYQKATAPAPPMPATNAPVAKSSAADTNPPDSDEPPAPVMGKPLILKFQKPALTATNHSATNRPATNSVAPAARATSNTGH
jgi:N-acetylmuramoyl-L-alanine amidase